MMRCIDTLSITAASLLQHATRERNDAISIYLFSNVVLIALNQ
ncbi:Hypothetical protein ETEE_3623 [Edwardsiella anguillarum ET080813]|uniref:Uncharacterized protein n=1 Tax=Edwardsiella anguillarum ET080813 TaxID=667120 RepID=A0A076LUB1_9GAMM|nr:Hypothetical protein ETEE_3623 [Edwardsiella anguillarum ET080813]